MNSCVLQTSLALGLPVSKNAFEKRVALETKQFCENKTIKIPGEERIKLMQKAASFNEAMVKDLTVFSYVDPQIRRMVKAETHAFFAGKTSAGAAAHSLQNKAGIYLRE